MCLHDLASLGTVNIDTWRRMWARSVHLRILVACSVAGRAQARTVACPGTRSQTRQSASDRHLRTRPQRLSFARSARPLVTPYVRGMHARGSMHAALRVQEKARACEVGSYVRMVGNVREPGSADGDVALQAFILRPVTDFNEARSLLHPWPAHGLLLFRVELTALPRAFITTALSQI